MSGLTSGLESSLNGGTDSAAAFAIASEPWNLDSQKRWNEVGAVGLPAGISPRNTTGNVVTAALCLREVSEVHAGGILDEVLRLDAIASGVQST